ncbi:unnamed protein product [Triticum turgidum subsp. durum]|uniref:NAC domain-containing protein n=1 Tax=Triticum turgidum subsp. durum TaxID=4567 RepID=A0A9R0RSM8_TRITD|nr:unnamed protein product [Triticum turgidum subsp. durum]
MMTAMVKAEPTGAAAGAEGSSGRRDAEAELNLPPGFRFHPTDDELVVHYLCRKVAGQPQPVPIIAEVDLYKFNPWDLPGAPSLPPLSPPLPCFFLSSFLLLGSVCCADLGVRAERALFGSREWYFFTPRDRKYPNGSRPNRSAGTGYWKATGADKPVAPRESGGRTVGIKKALVFYSGRAPRGVKTDWIMHEYRIAEADRAPGKKGSLKVTPASSFQFALCSPTILINQSILNTDPSLSVMCGYYSWTNGCCAGCTTRRTTGRSSRWSRTWLWRPGRTGRSWTRWRPTPCPTASRRTTPPRSTAPPACSSMVSWTWRSSRRGW